MEQERNFSNAQVEASSLPDFRRVALTPAAPAYLSWSLITQTAFWLLAAAVIVVVTHLPLPSIRLPWWLPLAPLAVAVVGAVYARLDARTRAWALREHDLVYRYGVLWRKTVIVPFARIQHVEAVHGPLERYLGLMRLKCFTAGGMSADLTVKGLARADARRVRQYLLEQIGQATDSPLEDRREGDIEPD